MKWLANLGERLHARRLQQMTVYGKRVAVRLIGVAVATGGLALMGFGTLGAPLASGGGAAGRSQDAQAGASKKDRNAALNWTMKKPSRHGACLEG